MSHSQQSDIVTRTKNKVLGRLEPVFRFNPGNCAVDLTYYRAENANIVVRLRSTFVYPIFQKGHLVEVSFAGNLSQLGRVTHMMFNLEYDPDYLVKKKFTLSGRLSAIGEGFRISDKAIMHDLEKRGYIKRIRGQGSLLVVKGL